MCPAFQEKLLELRSPVRVLRSPVHICRCRRPRPCTVIVSTAVSYSQFVLGFQIGPLCEKSLTIHGVAGDAAVSCLADMKL